MRTIDDNVLKAKTDREFRDVLISEYEPFIMQAAHKSTGQYISKSDDRWSVSLIAFNEAIQSYTYEKGRFIPFAELVIRRRLYDYLKKESKTSFETPVNPASFGDDAEEGEEDRGLRQQVMEKTHLIEASEPDAKWEIEALSNILNKYEIDFFDLITVSPKAVKTKTACAKAIVFISRNPILLESMRKTRNLPIKAVEQKLRLPRKILERHRKYIIAAVEIVSGDYPILCEYLSFVKEELSK